MKIVKLNRNFNINKNHGFEVALKFNVWDRSVAKVEKVITNQLGDQAWAWKYYPADKVKGNWAAGFGKRIKGEDTPYWIYLRKSSMLTMLLLALEKDER